MQVRAAVAIVVALIGLAPHRHVAPDLLDLDDATVLGAHGGLDRAEADPVAAPGVVGDRVITVRFDTNTVSAPPPWLPR